VMGPRRWALVPLCLCDPGARPIQKRPERSTADARR
jgi:hypothetical protein